ncbi:hypothetical protein JL721_2529 [Aureococcus anophagefferens]|nr:hypothetical protein JL721_2529 [Aureococcus anophagefferens]
MGRSFLQLLAALSAALSASLSAPRTCVVSDVAYGRVSGSLYKSFGGDLGAVHDVVAVAGTDEAGDDVFGLCAAGAKPGATVTLAAAASGCVAPKDVLTALDVAAGLAAAGGGSPRGALVTVLGSTDAALAATQALAALGSAPRVVTARRGGVSDAMDRGAAEACHPAALAADDDGEENDYFEGQEDAFAGSVVLDFAGDEGNRASCASCLDPTCGRRRLGPRAALPLALEAAPRPLARRGGGGFSLNPLLAAAAVKLGPLGGDAYAEAFGWPNDGETRKRLALDVCVPSVALVDFGAIDDALRDEFAWDEDVEDVDDLDADPVGDAVVFVTAKFCNSCRRLEPHYARLQRASTVDFLRVDATDAGPVLRGEARHHVHAHVPPLQGRRPRRHRRDVVADDDEARDRRGLPRVKS